MWVLNEREGGIEGPQVMTEIEEWRDGCVKKLELTELELFDAG